MLQAGLGFSRGAIKKPLCFILVGKIPHFVPHQHVVLGGNIDNKGKL